MTDYPAETPGRGGRLTHPSEDWDSREAWAARSRLMITPVAAPSILGLFGFAAASFMVASHLAEWWGNPVTAPPVLAPFAIFFGGLAQLLAAMWAYRARDGVATAVHGTWGAFWLSWGLLALLHYNELLPPGALNSTAFGFWWIPLAIITFFGAAAALGNNPSLFLLLILLATGSGFVAGGLIGTTPLAERIGGWLIVGAAAVAFYTAGAMMLQHAFGGRTILPLGRWTKRGNVPGHALADPIGYPGGMPGAKPGQ